MSQEEKFRVKVSTPAKPKRVPKIVSEQLKSAASPKMLSKMKKESVDCPVVKKEVAFLVCFGCSSFVNRISGAVGCAGGRGRPTSR